MISLKQISFYWDWFASSIFSSSKKFLRNSATSSWVRRQGSLSVRNSHRNKISCYDQVRLFSIIHSFIFISFKSSAASTETKVLPATAVNPLTLGSVALLRLMKGGRAGPSASSKKEFVKRELCASRSAAFAGHAERRISSFKCCTYEPRVALSREHGKSQTK